MRNLVYLQLTLLISINIFATNAKMLTSEFFSKDQVCQDAKDRANGRKAALIMVKTHLCDIGSTVCVKGMQAVEDPAFSFIHDNFVTYQTRFYSYSYDKESQAVLRNIYEAEDLIRAEYDKSDSDPEVYILGLNDCQVLGRIKVATHNDGFSKDRKKRYLAYYDIIMNQIDASKHSPYYLQVPEAFNENRAFENIGDFLVKPTIDLIAYTELSKQYPEKSLTDKHLEALELIKTSGLKIKPESEFNFDLSYAAYQLGGIEELRKYGKENGFSTFTLDQATEAECEPKSNEKSCCHKD